MKLRIFATVAAAAATLIAATMVYIAFQHNPQGEAFDQESGAVHYGYVLALFLTWLVPSFVLVAVCEGAVYLLGRIAKIWK
jgi:hypothetical protein